nr:hypothetical protein BaRGS_007717 [Batillaria attramentaria]
MSDGSGRKPCADDEGNIIPDENCVRIEQVPHECCKYHCLDADGKSRSPLSNDSTPLDGHPTASDDNITNLSLRLVASTVTSFLVLALLLFMVHRLRQRRLMMAMRRFEAQARNGHGDDDLDHYIPSEFMQIECPPYEDPPPPYSPPKPPHILPEDAPPPYEEVENNNITVVVTYRLDRNLTEMISLPQTITPAQRVQYLDLSQ